mmetsp:Transcript_9211/g.24300  ORF Transcript_9211/g.24300 Transcript_9211/m.24300 type:complete len:215 (-) Transcript_9211:1469-2113(-)
MQVFHALTDSVRDPQSLEQRKRTKVVSSPAVNCTIQRATGHEFEHNREVRYLHTCAKKRHNIWMLQFAHELHLYHELRNLRLLVVVIILRKHFGGNHLRLPLRFVHFTKPTGADARAKHNRPEIDGPLIAPAFVKENLAHSFLLSCSGCRIQRTCIRTRPAAETLKLMLRAFLLHHHQLFGNIDLVLVTLDAHSRGYRVRFVVLVQHAAVGLRL